MRLFALRALRRILREVDIRIERSRRGIAPVARAGNGRELEIEQLLRRIELQGDAERGYLEAHLQRLVRTLSLVPAEGGCVLELGSYGYMAAALDRVLGYREVRGAYYGASPAQEHKTVRIQGQPEFEFEMALFDAERHVYPYADGRLDVVLCCELIEHLLLDPMHLLVECQRILREGGLLLVTTPNAASFTSVACTLHGWRNPQVFSAYPAAGNHDTPHVREYTARELADAVTAAGFQIESLFTERIAGFDEGAWVKALLEEKGFDTALRGEQTYCLARKHGGVVCERYPQWLYAGG